jgi:hypothetical protein
MVLRMTLMLGLALTAAGCSGIDFSEEFIAEMELLDEIHHAIHVDLEAAGPETGVRRLHYPDGYLMAEYEVREGEPSGHWQIMRPGGRLWFSFDHETGWSEFVDTDGEFHRERFGPWGREGAQEDPPTAPIPPRR